VLGEGQMATAVQYRVKAAEFTAKTEAETNPTLQVEHARKAAVYLRLAELVDRNAMTDAGYEMDLKPAAP
jgi:PHD/YefM family antitoxin component YafN of YafNO toxin-antitoxin module